MKFIDKHSRLNIIDAAIIILLIAVLVIWAGLVKKTVSVEKAFKREIVTVGIKADEVSFEMYKLMNIGDRSVDTAPGFYSVLMKIQKFEPGEKQTQNSNEKYVNLILWLKVRAYSKNDILLYNRAPLKYGYDLEFEAEKYKLVGRIMGIIRNADQEELPGRE